MKASANTLYCGIKFHKLTGRSLTATLQASSVT